jgi:hypothetical protein
MKNPKPAWLVSDFLCAYQGYQCATDIPLRGSIPLGDLNDGGARDSGHHWIR